MLASCSLKALSFLPVELMCFYFKVKSPQRLKMCKFFQVVLSQLQAWSDTVAMYHSLSGRCGCRMFLSSLARWFLACFPTLVPTQLPWCQMVTWISEWALLPV